MTISSKQSLPQLTVTDAHRIDSIVNEAEAGLEQAVAQIRMVLERRDLVSFWSDEDAAFSKTFEPISSSYYRAARALQQLKEQPLAAEHRLRNIVDSQRI